MEHNFWLRSETIVGGRQQSPSFQTKWYWPKFGTGKGKNVSISKYVDIFIPCGISVSADHQKHKIFFFHLREISCLPGEVTLLWPSGRGLRSGKEKGVWISWDFLRFPQWKVEALSLTYWVWRIGNPTHLNLLTSAQNGLHRISEENLVLQKLTMPH